MNVQELIDTGALTARDVDALGRVKLDLAHTLTLATETTQDQLVSLAQLAARYAHGPRAANRLTVGKGVFGLPDSYLGFTLWHDAEHVLTGGIDEEGRVST